MSPRGSWVPTLRRERLPFSVSMSSSLIVIASSSGRCASVTTTAVISLVSEAIGRTASEFLLNRISFVSWSMTRATPDFSSSESAAWCRPISWPNEGLAGSARIVTTRRAPWRPVRTTSTWRACALAAILASRAASARLFGDSEAVTAVACAPTQMPARTSKEAAEVRKRIGGWSSESVGRESRGRHKNAQDQKLARCFSSETEGTKRPSSWPRRPATPGQRPARPCCAACSTPKGRLWLTRRRYPGRRRRR